MYMKEWPGINGIAGHQSNDPQVPHQWFKTTITCSEQIQTSLGVLCRSV